MIAALLLASCASTEEVSAGAPVGSSVPVDELALVDDSTTTSAPTSTLPTSTTIADAFVDDSATASGAEEDLDPDTPVPEPGLPNIVDRPDIELEDQEHLNRPWFAEVSGQIEQIDFDNPGEFFSFGPDGILNCAASEAYLTIDEAFIFRRDVTWGDRGLSQVSGYVPDGIPTADLIDEVIGSGPCFDQAAIASGEAPFVLTSRGPNVDGIANSVVIDATDEVNDAELKIVLATTGGRDIHLLATFTTLEVPTGSEVSDTAATELLEGLVARTTDAGERVALCTSLFGDADPGTRIDDQRCDGFDEYSPELRLSRYRGETFTEPAGVIVSPPTTTTTAVPPQQAIEDLIQEFELAEAWTLLIQATDVRPGEVAQILPTNAPQTRICESELGETARIGNQFDQWLQVETRIEHAVENEQILHVVGAAPSPSVADEAVRALASYGSCKELAEVLSGAVVSTPVDGLPPTVTAGTIWEVDTPGQPTIVGDFALEDGTVMAISVTSPTVTPERILELLDLSLSNRTQ